MFRAALIFYSGSCDCSILFGFNCMLVLVMTPNMRWNGAKSVKKYLEVDRPTASYPVGQFTQTSGASSQTNLSGSNANASQEAFLAKLLDEIRFTRVS